MMIGANIAIEQSRGIGLSVTPPSFNAFSPMKNTMNNDSANVEVLFIGDSMGDNQNEVSGTWGAQIAALYPKYTVNWINWDDTGLAYLAPIQIQAGTGSHTLNIYNACVGGTRSTYFFGSRYAAAIAARNPSLVIFLHGLNHVGAGVFANMIRGEFLTSLEDIRTTFPAANLAWIIENPKRDDTSMEVITEYSTAGTSVSMKQILDREAIIQPDITMIDAYSRFIALNKDTSLYSDATHGNTASGIALYMAAMMGKWVSTKPGAFAPGTPLMNVIGTNLLLNGDFASFAASPPTSWTAQNSVVITKDVSNPYSGHAYSCRLTAGAVGAPNMRQQLTAGNLTTAQAAGFVAYAVRLFAPSGGTATIARPNVNIGGGSNTGGSLRSSNDGKGRYRWYFYPDIPISGSVTSIQALVYADTASTGMDTTHPTDVDRVSMVAGGTPKNF